MAELNPLRRKLLDYLSVHGLNGANMYSHGWDEEGYYAKVPLTGEVTHEKFPWPEGFDYAWFSTLFRTADLEDYRLAGIRRPRVVE